MQQMKKVNIQHRCVIVPLYGTIIEYIYGIVLLFLSFLFFQHLVTILVICWYSFLAFCFVIHVAAVMLRFNIGINKISINRYKVVSGGFNAPILHCII